MTGLCPGKSDPGLTLCEACLFEKANVCKCECGGSLLKAFNGHVTSWTFFFFFLFFSRAISRGKSKWESSCQLHRKHVSAECVHIQACICWNMTERSKQQPYTANNHRLTSPPYTKNKLSLCCLWVYRRKLNTSSQLLIMQTACRVSLGV